MPDAELVKVILDDRILARLLRILLDHGGRYTTKKLAHEVSSPTIGLAKILKAEKQGYIRPREPEKIRGKRRAGRPAIYNVLTPEGRELARLAKELGV